MYPDRKSQPVCVCVGSGASGFMNAAHPAVQRPQINCAQLDLSEHIYDVTVASFDINVMPSPERSSFVLHTMNI